jgi:ATP-binding cassette, subfamily B, bacterial MsbA
MQPPGAKAPDKPHEIRRVHWNPAARRADASGSCDGVPRWTRAKFLMHHLAIIFRFGWPYMRRYWSRLVAGMLLGVVFGLSNASFIWATKTLFQRLKGPDQAAQLTLTNPGSGEISWQTAPAKDGAASAAQGTLAAGQSTTIDLGPVAPAPGPAVPVSSSLLERTHHRVNAWIDPWMPLMGREIDWRQVVGGFLFLPVLVAVRSFVGYLSTYCMCWVSERVMNDLRYDVLAQLYRLSLDFFNRSKIGDLMTRINVDTVALYKATTNGLSDLVKEPFTILAVLAGLCLVNWKLTLLAVVFLPLCAAPLIILGRKVRRAAKASLSANITQSSLLVEAIDGIRVIKAFGMEAGSLARFKELCQQIIHHDMKSVQARELVNPIIETVSMLGLGLLIVFIFITQTSVPDLAGFLTGVVILFTPVKKLASVHVFFQQASVGVERLAQVMSERPSVKEPSSPKALKSFEREIRLEDIRFGYGEKPVLDGFSLTIPRGFKLGVAGESGSGKSTLVNLLFRFYDVTGGSIRIDGHDLREVTQRDLHALMALVSQ